MKDTIGRLIDLQRADDGIVELERTLKELDRSTAAAQQGLDAANTALEAAHHDSQEAAAAVHRKEMDLKEREDSIAKCTLQLNTASNNKEYSGLLLKIGTLKAECGKLEEEILLAMDAQEEVEGKEAAAKAVVGEAEGQLRAAEKRMEEERGRIEREIGERRATREECATSIPSEHLRLYDKIRGGNTSSGTAVVPVHGEYCQGCQMRVTPQEYSQLVSQRKLVRCRTCQRILVLEV